MAFWLVVLLAIYLLYVLLVQGALWKIILAVFGWCGMVAFMVSLHNPGLTHWAAVIATVIVIMAASATKEL